MWGVWVKQQVLCTLTARRACDFHHHHHQSVFQTVPLSLSDWAIILPLTCSVWIVDELRKLLFPETPSGTRVVASATGAAGAGAGAGAGAHVA